MSDLDPMPWKGYDNSRKSRWSRYAVLFEPRPAYEQSRSAYAATDREAVVAAMAERLDVGRG